MKKNLVVLSVVLLLSVVCSTEKLRADESEFIALFNGKTLEGWKASENKDSWSVTDGAIVCDGPRSHLFYVGDGVPLKDFHFV